MDYGPVRWAAEGLALLCALGCAPEPVGGPTTVTVSGSVLGAEGLILRRQLERFDREHGEIRVQMRPTPDAADLRHQQCEHVVSRAAGKSSGRRGLGQSAARHFPPTKVPATASFPAP